MKHNFNKNLIINCSFLAGTIIGGFAFLRFISGDQLLGIIDAIMALTFLAIAYNIYKKGSNERAIYLCAIMAVIGTLTTLYFNGAIGVYWVFVITIVVFYVFPHRHAFAFAAVTVLGACLLLRSDSNYIHILTFLVADSLICLFSFLFSQDLESRVAQRTAQLTASNQELLDAKRITEEAIQSREYFLANISHEIRTPMNGILGTVDLLKMESLTQEQQDYLKVIQRSGISLLTVINDVLDYSKLNIQKLALNNKAFNLAVLLRETIETYRTNLNDKTSLSLSIAPVLLDSQFVGDEIRLHQVLTNLLNNASKFTDRGFIKVEVKLLEQEAKYTRIQINISDSGIGIDRDLQAKLFQPFTQADQSTTRRFGGTGLGLSICKQLLNLMDGSIVVESEAGQGSTFTIDFVLQNTTKGDEQEHTIANVLTPLNVLLVEDNPVNQAVAAKLLQRQGCEVTFANDGAQAVNKAKTNSYDLILMDCDMPVMDGYEATRQIRQWEIEQNRKPIPIYALSAHAVSEQIDVCYAAGMDGHLSKPIVLDVLKVLLLEVADQ